MRFPQAKLYGIGEFAKQTGLSPRTIRHYEEIGLLLPCSVNPKTQYRQYSDYELFRAITINMMRNVFSLEKVKLFLQTKNISDLLPIYKESRKEINEKIEEMIKIRERLENRIMVFEHHLQESKTGKYRKILPKIKQIEERKLLFFRKKEVYDLKNLMIRSQKILKTAVKNKLFLMDPTITIFHEDMRQHPHLKIDYEYCNHYIGGNDLTLRSMKTLPAGQYATLLAKGTHQEVSHHHYPILLNFIEQNGYKSIGPLIKEFKIFYTHVKSSEEVVSELQIQVEKKLSLKGFKETKDLYCCSI